MKKVLLVLGAATAVAGIGVAVARKVGNTVVPDFQVPNGWDAYRSSTPEAASSVTVVEPEAEEAPKAPVAKKAPAKKAVPAAKKAVAKKVTPAKKAVPAAKKAVPAKKAAATK